VKVSIIICTHDHLASLRETVAALGKVRTPFETELLLVENACTDETASFIESVKLPNMQCRPLHEPRKGLARARNLGLAMAQGELIAFTDDDVRPVPDWLEQLCRQLNDGSCDVVAGSVRLAPHLERPWMTRRLRAFLSVTEGLEDGWLTEIIGANMAFHRRVLERVPRFDEELGAGALGFGEDSLFSWQLERAGLRLGRAPEAVVEHHCNKSRLQRRHYLDSAKRHGQMQAYLLHHWKHETITMPRFRYCYAMAKILRRRIFSSSETRSIEGCAEWEISLTTELEKYRSYIKERRRPHNYERFGLIKLRPQ
jgi:glycosyltransferase involved in cell wall biosynthesis